MQAGVKTWIRSSTGPHSARGAARAGSPGSASSTQCHDQTLQKNQMGPWGHSPVRCVYHGAMTSIWWPAEDLSNHPPKGPSLRTFLWPFFPRWTWQPQASGSITCAKCLHATHMHLRPQACQKLLHAVSCQEMRQCEISEAANGSASKLISKIKIPCPGRPRS